MSFKQSYGKGGNHVVDTLLKEIRYKKYDALAALTEDDEPPKASSLRELRKARGALLVLSPCLEGLLLATLGRPVPGLSSECKDRVAAIDGRDLSDPLNYEQHWARGRLDAARQTIPVLEQLIALFE